MATPPEERAGADAGGHALHTKGRKHAYENVEVGSDFGVLLARDDPFEPDFEAGLTGGGGGKKAAPYDEVSLQSGRPVLAAQDAQDARRDPLTAVTFTSPLRDQRRAEPSNPPTPAPRLSKLKEAEKVTPVEAFNLHPSTEAIYEELPQDDEQAGPSSGDRFSQWPSHAVAASSPAAGGDNIYSEPLAESATNVNLSKPSLLEAAADDAPSEAISPVLLQPKGPTPPHSGRSRSAATIDIRRDVNKWYEMAVHELDRDREIVEFLEDRESGSSPRATPAAASRGEGDESQKGAARRPKRREYLSVAIPGQKFEIVDGVQRPMTSTLLKDFDPCFEIEEEDDLDDGDEQRERDSTSVDEEQNVHLRRDSKSSDRPSAATERDSSVSATSASSLDIPPPKEAPPPPPRNLTVSPEATPSSQEPQPTKRRQYENLWQPADDDSVPTSPSVVSEQLGAMSVASADSGSSPKPSPTSTGQRGATGLPSKSSSTTNLSFLTKKLSFTTKFSRKLSIEGRRASLAEEDEGGATNKRKSSLMDVSGRSHSGPLQVSKNSKGQAASQPKWCVLSDGHLRYYQQNSSMAEPKDSIPLNDVQSLYRRRNEDDECVFDVAFLRAKGGKLSVRTFAASTEAVRDAWLDRLAFNLCGRSGFISAAKLGRSNVKSLFSGQWQPAWLALDDDQLVLLATQDALEDERLSLKWVKNVTMVKDAKNLQPPDASLPVLVVDFVDRSLYLHTDAEKETEHWRRAMEDVAFSNEPRLSDQQVTKDDVPAVVDRCVDFVFRHGCMTEGIYRHSGVKTKIDRLLASLRGNAWSAALTREEYSEHDVAGALKRFMRTLEDPLLTSRLREEWVAATKIQRARDRLEQ